MAIAAAPAALIARPERLAGDVANAEIAEIEGEERNPRGKADESQQLPRPDRRGLHSSRVVPHRDPGNRAHDRGRMSWLPSVAPVAEVENPYTSPS